MVAMGDIIEARPRLHWGIPIPLETGNEPTVYNHRNPFEIAKVSRCIERRERKKLLEEDAVVECCGCTLNSAKF